MASRTIPHMLRALTEEKSIGDLLVGFTCAREEDPNSEVDSELSLVNGKAFISVLALAPVIYLVLVDGQGRVESEDLYAARWFATAVAIGALGLLVIWALIRRKMPLWLWVFLNQVLLDAVFVSFLLLDIEGLLDDLNFFAGMSQKFWGCLSVEKGRIQPHA
mmetsp:Transcript_43733/g.109142  ORF Transcript_43733/g.109142 Transcript_43733/m.109142 type:complete len:162 (-) Transcript_43733:1227-1712(-)